MQGLADGYFILPCTLPDYLARTKLEKVDATHSAFAAVEADVRGRIAALLETRGRRSVDSFHRELGRVMWDNCGMTRSDASLKCALGKVQELKAAFHRDVRVPGDEAELNQSLEKAGRVIDFLELAELMCLDALHRTESCGGHFRVESQAPDGEAMRDDDKFCYVAAWEWKGDGAGPELHKEPLTFEYVHPAQRSYK